MVKILRRRGMVLLQTLVTSVILSMISVMVMKWVLGRYMLAARNYRSAVATVHANGYAMQRFSAWNINTAAIPSSGSTSMDSNNVGYSAGGIGMKTIVFSSDEDQ